MDFGGSRRDDYATEIASNISCHGLQDWAKADSLCRKLFWSVIMAGSFGAIIFYNYNIVSLFFDNPTATSIQESKQDSMTFPNVTVCNTGKYNETYISEHIDIPWDQIKSYYKKTDENRQTIIAQFVRYLMILAYNKEDFKEDSLNKTMQIIYQHNFDQSKNPKAFNVAEFVNNAAYQCDQLLKSCRFSYKGFDCCSSSYVTRVFTDFGTCYHMKVAPRYAGQSEAVQDFPGFGSALEFKTELSLKAIPSAESKTKNFGVRLHIGPYITITDHSPVLVPSQMHAFIRLDATKRHYRDKCLSNPWLNKSDLYTPGTCTWEKLFDATNARCKCSPLGYYFDYKKLGANRLCTVEEIKNCMIPIRSDIGRDGDLKDIDDVCMRECDTLTYEPVVSYFKIRSKTPQDDIILNRFSVYFGQLAYNVVVEETLMSVDTLVSSIGGVCGLWTGMTLITVIQCLSLFVCKPCKEWCRKRRDRKKDIQNRKQDTDSNKPPSKPSSPNNDFAFKGAV